MQGASEMNKMQLSFQLMKARQVKKGNPLFRFMK